MPARSAELPRTRHLLFAWREARPVVQVMFQARFACGAVLASAQAGPPDPAAVVPGALAWLCATWCVYLLNGLCDLVEDRGNSSPRPLASGCLPPSAARRVVALLAAAALVLGAAVSVTLLVLVAAMLALGWAYSAGPRPLKRNVIGFAASVTGGGVLTYLAGCVSTGRLPGVEAAVFMAAMSLWMAMAGCTKDLSDVAGDRAAGRRTLPILLGDRAARRVMAVQAVAVGVTLLTAALLAAPSLLLPGLVLTGGALALAVCAVRSTGAGERSLQRRPYRLFMGTQCAVHVLVLAGHLV